MTKWPGNWHYTRVPKKSQFYAQCTGFKFIDKMDTSHVCLHTHSEIEVESENGISYASNTFFMRLVITLWQTNNKKQWSEKKREFHFYLLWFVIVFNCCVLRKICAHQDFYLLETVFFCIRALLLYSLSRIFIALSTINHSVLFLESYFFHSFVLYLLIVVANSHGLWYKKKILDD